MKSVNTSKNCPK